MKLQSEVKTVSPAMAKTWLSEGRHNRNLKPTVVAKYAEAMKRGEWVLHHQGIAFDTTGVLMDGQHRLHAIIEAGVPVKLNVTTGVPVEAFATVDDGAQRAVRDLIAIALPGQSFTTELASIARGMLEGFTGHIGGGEGPSKQVVYSFALECKEHIEPYIPLHKKMKAGLAAAFANAEYTAGVPRAFLVEVANNLMTLTFSGDADPTKQLYKRCQENSSARRDAVSLRYRLGVSGLRALIEGRPLKVLLEAQRDWVPHEYKKLKKREAGKGGLDASIAMRAG